MNENLYEIIGVMTVNEITLKRAIQAERNKSAQFEEEIKKLKEPKKRNKKSSTDQA